YMTRLLSVSAGIFLAGTPGGSVEAILFRKDGTRLTPKESRFPLRRMEPEIGISPGKVVFITGAEALYTAEGARDPIGKSFVAYSRDPVMRAFLGNAGVRFADKAEGFPIFSGVSGGHSLALVSEKGYAFTPDEVTLLTLQALYTLGKETLAVPSDAPSACESLSSDLGKSLLRVGRDREAEALYASEPALHHAPFAALALIRALLKTGKTLSAFSASIPASVSVLRDYRAEGDRLDLLERFAEGLGGMKCDRSDGLRVFIDGACLSLRLSPYERLLTLKAESPNEETSAELCDFYFNRLSELEHGE
ncbi:MAG: hypothetical protein IKX85_05110, partial [Clostridia bacterium]|nr:hypothetical protein [Clostridia bacterium]